MHRILLIAALLAAAAPARAQLDEPSTTQGFFMGINFLGASLDDDADDDFDPLTGGGLGLELGYGFSSGLALFLGVDAGGLEGDDGVEAIDTRTQVDLGLRMNIGAGRRRLVPYVEGAFSGIVLEVEDEFGDQSLLSGGGITLGGGLQYFVLRTLSLNGGMRVSMGALTTLERDGDDEELDDQHFEATRLTLGVAWNP